VDDDLVRQVVQHRRASPVRHRRGGELELSRKI
jgi:hypothetical protein